MAIKSGLYEGKLEIHLRETGIEDPTSIPVMLERNIPWDERRRSNILTGTTIAIEFPDGTEEFAVVCDYDTIDGQCVVITPVGPEDCPRKVTHRSESCDHEQ